MTLVPAALSVSYEDMTILPVIDCKELCQNKPKRDRLNQGLRNSDSMIPVYIRSQAFDFFCSQWREPSQLARKRRSTQLEN